MKWVDTNRNKVKKIEKEKITKEHLFIDAKTIVYEEKEQLLFWKKNWQEDYIEEKNAADVL